MGAPCRIIPVNVFDLATLTTTIAPYSGTPIANLQNPRRGRVGRWPAASGTQSIKGTWNGQGFQVGGVSGDGFNLEPAALVRFRGWANADWTGTLLVDTGSVAPYNAAALGSFQWGRDPLGSSIFDSYLGYKYWVAWFARATIASFQIDITDTTNSWQYVEVRRAVLGDYIETSYNASFGTSAGWASKTEQDEADGGSLFANRKLPRRMVKGSLDFLTPTERQSVYDFTRYVEAGKNFLITFQAGEGAGLERDLTLPQAKFVSPVPMANWVNAQTHSLPFTIVEA